MKLGWQATITGDIPVTPDTITQSANNTVDGKTPHHATTFDLYQPAEPWALVVYIHGGGWQAGEKDRPPGYRSLLEAGLAVASVSYRFSDETDIDGMVEDIRAATGAARATLASRGYESIPWVLWGISAGGHLALLAATLSDKNEVPAAVCSWCGPTDLPALGALEGVKEHCHADVALIVGKLVGAESTATPALQERASHDRLLAWSPIAHVRAGLPPHLLIHGSDDGLVPPDQSRHMHARLIEADVTSEYYEVPDGTHAMPPSHWEGIERMVTFFRNALATDSEKRP